MLGRLGSTPSTKLHDLEGSNQTQLTHTVVVNKKLTFRIRSTIVVRNEIHSFAAVAQYDTFAYFRMKVQT